jgi:hypothetical protein
MPRKPAGNVMKRRSMPRPKPEGLAARCEAGAAQAKPPAPRKRAAVKR